MTIMNSPKDNAFEDMLKAYAAPVDDDGFTDALLGAIAARQKRLQRLKFLFLASGCFLGGVMAAAQFQSALMLMNTVSLPNFTIDPLWAVVAALISGFIAWMTLDNKAAG